MELARYAFRQRLAGTAALSVLLAVFAAGMVAMFAAGMVAMFPSIEQSGVDLEAYLEAFPPALREAFGLVSLGSIEGFLAAEFYQFGLVLLLGRVHRVRGWPAHRRRSREWPNRPRARRAGAAVARRRRAVSGTAGVRRDRRRRQRYRHRGRSRGHR